MTHLVLVGLRSMGRGFFAPRGCVSGVVSVCRFHVSGYLCKQAAGTVKPRYYSQVKGRGVVAVPFLFYPVSVWGNPFM
jgi:hypothetical protein